MHPNPESSPYRLHTQIADYQNRQHAQHLLQLLDLYARDKMGGGAPLSPYVQDNLIESLAALPYATSILAYADERPVGLLNSFESFSTFRCKPVMNIHDLVVMEEFRGLGISQILLRRIEDVARQKGCCKLTLEVLEGNAAAQTAYRKFGFSGYQLDPAMGNALFWQKNL